MTIQTLILAAGCFWGVEHAFQMETGVVNTEVGYIGGTIKNPTYEEVSTGETGYAEAVKITYDTDKTNAERLLRTFFKIHNPTTLNRQGPDIGTQYRSAIFYQNKEQKELAENLITELNESGRYQNPIVTEVVPAGIFYPAEEYHQNYLLKQGKKSCHLNRSNKEWKETLSPEQYYVMRQRGTERPFTGKYVYTFDDGIYRCAGCSNPLFKSRSKFASSCGWPSFDKAIDGAVQIYKDFSHFMIRNEVVCSRCGAHLGHIFPDGPTKTGDRYCINSVSLDFEEK
ncbi:MAG: peptide-methionine (S)-S-oxide reductase MsrA [Alphaproteobacteria bacterium]|nr:peptide-methionine (S)-S-oxide reductase MsrA [Alphaproteobacteria bacterium]